MALNNDVLLNDVAELHEILLGFSASLSIDDRVVWPFKSGQIFQ